MFTPNVWFAKYQDKKQDTLSRSRQCVATEFRILFLVSNSNAVKHIDLHSSIPSCCFVPFLVACIRLGSVAFEFASIICMMFILLMYVVLSGPYVGRLQLQNHIARGT